MGVLGDLGGTRGASAGMSIGGLVGAAGDDLVDVHLVAAAAAALPAHARLPRGHAVSTGAGPVTGRCANVRHDSR